MVQVLQKIYEKRDDFDFDIVNFPFLDGDVPWRPSDGVILQKRRNLGGKKAKKK